MRSPPASSNRTPLMVPLTIVTGLYVSALAGNQEVLGLEARLLTLPLLCFAALVACLYPTRSPVVRPMVGWVVALCLWLAVTGTWSAPSANVAGVTTDIAYLGGFVVLAAVIVSALPSSAFNWLWWLLYFTAVLFAVSALILGTVTEQGRLAAFGGGPNVFVRIVGMGVVATAALVLPNPSGRWILLAPMPVLAVAALLSGSRGGAIAIFIAFAALAWIVVRHGTRAMRRALVTGLVAALVVSYFTVWPVVQDYVQQRFFQVTLVDRYSSGRGDIIGLAIDLFGDNLLFGAGIDSIAAETGGRFVHAHNLFLNAAVEGGLVALLLLIGALVSGVRAAHAKGSVLASMWLVAATLIFTSSMFSGGWYDSRFVWFFLIVGAEVTARKRADRTSPAVDGASGARENRQAPVGATNEQHWG